MPKHDDELPLPGQQVADRETFAAVFRRYYAPLVRYARGITRDAATAADVVQDVFLRLWQDRDHVTIETSLNAMLYTMVRNRALNANRRRQRMAGGVAVEDALQGRVADGFEENATAAEDLRRLLHRWVGELPPRRREAFALSRYHGLSHAEIARIMDVSDRTVDTHIVLALRELRRRLDELQDEDDKP